MSRRNVTAVLLFSLCAAACEVEERDECTTQVHLQSGTFHAHATATKPGLPEDATLVVDLAAGTVILHGPKGDITYRISKVE